MITINFLFQVIKNINLIKSKYQLPKDNAKSHLTSKKK